MLNGTVADWAKGRKRKKRNWQRLVRGRVKIRQQGYHIIFFCNSLIQWISLILIPTARRHLESRMQDTTKKETSKVLESRKVNTKLSRAAISQKIWVDFGISCKKNKR